MKLTEKRKDLAKFQSVNCEFNLKVTELEQTLQLKTKMIGNQEE